ncbi:adult cuticle protein 1-like [Episyrphus balteatus]|uniref:adult cuticle protein 1-like n=1 Tax=Episyrphus balteatus TaxID=286459 RepID=UPI0024861666|nr:adult cuticle protein 1-like [Episyrphus balteatus]
MKFAVFAVVVLALALGAQSSVILGAPGPLLAVSGPAGIVTVPGAVSIQAAPGAISLQQGPAVAVAAPAVVAAAPVVVGAEGTYVAKTRGAVHVAPLPGHLQSAASVNLQPAPGTL